MRECKSTKFVNNKLSDLCKVSTSEGNMISGPLAPSGQRTLLTPSTTWSQENLQEIIFCRVYTPRRMSSQILVMRFFHFLHAPTQNSQDLEKSIFYDDNLSTPRRHARLYNPFFGKTNNFASNKFSILFVEPSWLYGNGCTSWKQVVKQRGYARRSSRNGTGLKITSNKKVCLRSTILKHRLKYLITCLAWKSCPSTTSAHKSSTTPNRTPAYKCS